MGRLHRLQEVGVGNGGRQRQQPDQNTDQPSHHLLPATVVGVDELRDGQVAVDAHAGEEEDAAEEVDAENQVGEFTDGLSEGPAAALQQRGHPDRQGGHHAQVGHRQVQDVQVRLVAGPVGVQVDPDHQGVSGEAHEEDEDVEDGQDVEEGGMTDGPRTQQRLYVGQVVVVGQVQLLPQLKELAQVAGGQTHGGRPGRQRDHQRPAGPGSQQSTELSISTSWNWKS